MVVAAGPRKPAPLEPLGALPPVPFGGLLPVVPELVPGALKVF